MKISLKQLIFCCLVFIVFLIPLEEIISIGGRASLLRYLGLAIVPFFLIDILSQRKINCWSIEQGIFFVFVLWAIMSIAWSYSWEATSTLVLTYISLFFFVWLIIYYVDSLQKISVITIIYLIGCLVSLFLGRYSSAEWISQKEFVRYGGGGLNLNDYAFILAIGCALSFMHIFLSRKRLLSIVFLIITFTLLAGIISTLSRAGFLAVVVLSSGLLYFCWRSLKHSFSLILFACVYIGILLLLVPNIFWVRALEGTSAGTFISRKILWEAGIEAWKYQPIIGIGAGAFVPATILLNNRLFLVAHNTFISVLVELGIIGLVLFVFIYFLLLRIGWRKFISYKNSDNLKATYIYFIGFLTLLVFLPAFLSLTFEYKKVLWFTIALAISCRRVLDRERTI